MARRLKKIKYVRRCVVPLMVAAMTFTDVATPLFSTFGGGVIETYASTYNPEILFDGYGNEAGEVIWRAPQGMTLGFPSSSVEIEQRDSMNEWGILFIEDPNQIEYVTLTGFSCDNVFFDGYSLIFQNAVFPRYPTAGQIKVGMKDGRTYTKNMPKMVAMTHDITLRQSSWPAISSYHIFNWSVDLDNTSDNIEMSMFYPDIAINYGNASQSNLYSWFDSIYIDGKKLEKYTDYEFYFTTRTPSYITVNGENYYEFAGQKEYVNNTKNSQIGYTGKVVEVRAVVRNNYLQGLSDGVHFATYRLKTGEGYSKPFVIMNSKVVEDVLPDVTTATQTFDGNAPADVAYDTTLGAGTTVATGVSSVKIGDEVLSSSDYEFTDNKVKIKTSKLETLPAGTYTVTVTFNNSVSTVDTAELIVKNTDKLPDVITESQEYNGDNPADAVYDVTLGKGTTVATGIDSVKIGDETLSTSDYEFEDNKIKIKPSKLDTLNPGTYTVTVTFNNGDATVDTAGLTVKNTNKLPAVLTDGAEYDAKNPDDAVYDVTLGSGEKEASGIKGVTIDGTPLDADDWELGADNKLTIKQSALGKLTDGVHDIEVTFDNPDETKSEATITIKNNEEWPDIDENVRTFDNDSPTNVNYPVYLGTGLNIADTVTTLKLTDIFEDTVTETSDSKWIKTRKYAGDDVVLISKSFLSTLEDGTYDVNVIFNTQPDEHLGASTAQLEVINHKEKEPEASGDVIYNVTIVINVYVNGEKLEDSDYTFDIDTGDLLIKDEFIETLDPGIYPVEVETSEGQPEEEREILEPIRKAPARSTAPSFDEGTRNVTKGEETDVEFNYSLGTGAGAASEISSVKLNGTDVTFTAEDGTLTITGEYLSHLEPGTYTLEVVFDDAAGSTFNNSEIIVVGASSGPTLEADDVNWYAGSTDEVTFTYTLGEGSKAATRILSVVIDGNPVGFIAEDGTLSISDTVMNELSVGDHTAIVTFDDSSHTSYNVVITVSEPFEESEPSLTAKNFTFPKDALDDMSWPYDLGSGDKAATGIWEVIIDGANVEFTEAGGILTVDKSEIEGLDVGEHDVVVIFNDGSETTVNMTLKITDTEETGEAPSVTAGDKEFDKNAPSDIEWPVDLGTGDKAATDVTVKIDGTEVDASIEDGKIVIPSDVLDGLDEGEHEVEFIFNDEDGTTVDNIKITVRDSGTGDEEGEAPSLTKKNVTYDKNAPADVVYIGSLGSGDKAATDVAEVRIDGESVNFTVSHYEDKIQIMIGTSELDDLDLGSHEVEIEFNDSEGTTIGNMTITVVDNSGSGSGDEEGEAPSVVRKNTSIDKDNPSDVSYDFDLGSGDKAATDVTDVRIDEEPVDFDIVDNKIVISSDVLAGLDEGRHEIKFIFDDVDNTTVGGMTITVTSNEEEEGEGPAVNTATKTYNKTNPSDLEYTYSLGSGDLAATDIISVSVDGTEVEFEVADGTLTIIGDSLNDIENGTYELLVVFDDEAGTEDTHAKIKIIGRTDSGEGEGEGGSGSGGDNPSGGDNTGDNTGGNTGGNTGSDKPAEEAPKKAYRPSNTRPSSSSRPSGGSGSSGNKTTTINDNDVALSGGPGVSNGLSSSTGSWEGSGDSWKFRKPDGSYAKSEWITWNGENYHFNTDGIMETGWYLDTTGKWYVLNRGHDGKFGAALRGWYYEKDDGKWYYLDPVSTAMLIGWQTIDGKTYYFAETVSEQTYFGDNQSGWVYNAAAGSRPYGSMYVNEVTPDGTYVNSNGER